MKCPRQVEAPPGPYRDKESEWQDRDGVRACSYCGSMHPEDFFSAIERGEEIGPTDKSYKAYVDGMRGKFYFQHLSEDEMRRFVALLNERKITIGYPGHFYVKPFFIK